jgi:1,4-dihydroxy-2-naphthoyl-CoA synthase
VLYENRVLSAREACDYGFVYRVVPRAELDAEVMAYARRVCEEDPFEARMIKRACNQAEDIMGFTASIHNGHDVNMLKSISNAAVTKDAVTPAPGPRRHMGRVDRAVARFRARRMA